RPRPDQLRLRIVLAVIDHQREIDVAVGHVARDMAARAPGLHLAKAVNVLVELRRRFEIGDFQRDMVDPRHGRSSCSYHAALHKKRLTPSSPVASSISPWPAR